jgi:RNase H-fold protein (predicted Holliday junction resolvase)
MKDKISTLLDQGHNEPPEAEYYLQSEDYCRAVEEFAKNHKVSRIVVGLPHHNDDDFEKTRKYIESMKSRVKCQLVVVKSKSSISSG